MILRGRTKKYNIIFFSFRFRTSGSTDLAPPPRNMAFFVNQDFLSRVKSFESGLSKADQYLNIRQVVDLVIDWKAHGTIHFQMLVISYTILVLRTSMLFVT